MSMGRRHNVPLPPKCSGIRYYVAWESVGVKWRILASKCHLVSAPAAWRDEWGEKSVREEPQGRQDLGPSLGHLMVAALLLEPFENYQL